MRALASGFFVAMLAIACGGRAIGGSGGTGATTGATSGHSSVGGPAGLSDAMAGDDSGVLLDATTGSGPALANDAASLLPLAMSDSGPQASAACDPAFAETNYCQASLCDNGQIDTCSGPPGCAMAAPNGNGINGACTLRPEPCDGTDLGDASCASLGFIGGQLACAPTCNFDLSKCQAIGPLGSHLVSVGTLTGVSRYVYDVAIAGSDQSVAIAWAVEDDTVPGIAGIWFAQLAASLTEPTVPPQQLVAGSFLGSFAIAPSPVGWTLAVAKQTAGLEVDSIDPSGHIVQRIQINTPEADAVTLAPRPSGGPLVVWQRADSTLAPGAAFAAVLADDGTGATPPVTVPLPAAIDATSGAVATFVGDGFLVGALTNDYRNPDPSARVTNFAIARVLPTGAIDGPAVTPVGARASVSFLASDMSEVRIGFNSVATGPAWDSLDTHGNVLAGPTPFPSGVANSGDDSGMSTVAARSVAVYGSTMAVLTGGPAALDFAEVDSTGALQVAPLPILHVPQQLPLVSFAKRGPDLVLAWPQSPYICSGSGLGLARITP